MAERFMTIGEVARALGCPMHRIQYLQRCGRIKASERIGRYHAFSQDDVENVQKALAWIECKKAGTPVGSPAKHV